jgi:acetyl esterase/lipase
MRHLNKFLIVAGIAVQPAMAADELLPPPTAHPAVKKAAAPDVPKFANVQYGDGTNTANLLDIYLPEKVDKPVPVVVWVHGGGWANGDKSPSKQFLQLLPHGFAVASINYRLSGEAPFPAQIDDCKGAIRYLRAHAKEFQIDPDRIGVWGVSAGGHLVALLGTSGDVKELEGKVGGNLNVSSRVQAVSDYAGPTDLSKVFAQGADMPAFMNNVVLRGYYENLLGGGPVETHPDLIRLANPITYVTADDPPFQIFHGDKDVMVPIGQAQLLADALKVKGVECDYTILPGMGHGFGQKQYLATIAFFETHLKTKNANVETHK